MTDWDTRIEAAAKDVTWVSMATIRQIVAAFLDAGEPVWVIDSVPEEASYIAQLKESETLVPLRKEGTPKRCAWKGCRVCHDPLRKEGTKRIGLDYVGNYKPEDSVMDAALRNAADIRETP